MWRSLLTICFRWHYYMQHHLPWVPQSLRWRHFNLHSFLSACKEQLNMQTACGVLSTVCFFSDPCHWCLSYHSSPSAKAFVTDCLKGQQCRVAGLISCWITSNMCTYGRETVKINYPFFPLEQLVLYQNSQRPSGASSKLRAISKSRDESRRGGCLYSWD